MKDNERKLIFFNPKISVLQDNWHILWGSNLRPPVCEANTPPLTPQLIAKEEREMTFKKSLLFQLRLDQNSIEFLAVELSNRHIKDNKTIVNIY